MQPFHRCAYREVQLPQAVQNPNHDLHCVDDKAKHQFGLCQADLYMLLELVESHLTIHKVPLEFVKNGLHLSRAGSQVTGLLCLHLSLVLCSHHPPRVCQRELKLKTALARLCIRKSEHNVV